MRRRLREDYSTARNLTLIALLMLTASGCGKTSDAPAKTGFAVPDGKPDKIFAFVKQLRENSPKSSDPQEKIDYIRNTQRAMMEAGDKILAQQAEDESLAEAVAMKIFAMIGLATDQLQPPSQAEARANNILEFINKLREDKREIVVKTANEFLNAARALQLKSMPINDRTKLADDAIQHVVDSKGSQASVRNMGFLIERFEKIGEVDTAASLCDRLVALVENIPDKRLRAYAFTIRGRANRLRLPGNKLELQGTLLDGGILDWESYRGKVVLVDFWATWCGPCLAELPNVKAAYNAYHSKGFDIVSISLDHDRQALEKFLAEWPIPWAQLFEDPKSKSSGGSNPMALKYDISSIPVAFLVDKEGKVISLEARGPELRRLLGELLD